MSFLVGALCGIAVLLVGILRCVAVACSELNQINFQLGERRRQAEEHAGRHLDALSSVGGKRGPRGL